MKMYAEYGAESGERCQSCHAITGLITFRGRADKIIMCQDCAEEIGLIIKEKIAEIEEV